MLILRGREGEERRRSTPDHRTESVHWSDTANTNTFVQRLVTTGNEKLSEVLKIVRHRKRKVWQKKMKADDSTFLLFVRTHQFQPRATGRICAD
jgi:hypothetical protein